MEHLRDISIFVLVAKSGSFKSAAIQLGLPGSTISRRIAALERALNVRLFHRNTRTVVLINAGHQLLARSDRLLHEIQQLTLQVTSELSTIDATTIRISAPPEFAENCLGAALADFMRLHPEIKLDIDSTSRPVDLVAERFDLAIRMGEVRPQSHVARSWLQCTHALYASPDYIDSHGEPVVPPDLAEHQIILTEHERDDVITLRRRDETFEVVPHSRLQVRGDRLAKVMCLKGAGLGLLPDYAAAAHVEAGRLIHVLDEWSAGTRQISLVTPSRSVSRTTRLLLDFLLDRVKDRPACFGRHLGAPIEIERRSPVKAGS